MKKQSVTDKDPQRKNIAPLPDKATIYEDDLEDEGKPCPHPMVSDGICLACNQKV
jgi:hypothetical protein